jgi:DNA-directed RNA polymerase specialized sigma24 family protein
MVQQTMTETQRLLADYLSSGSEAAFRELVERYTGLVYSSALRLVEGDTHRAEDVAQTVFVDLARQARKLSAETRLGGWLYRHTCFVATTAMRGERRRRAREREVIQMNAPEDHSKGDFTQVAPVLDEAIGQLTPAGAQCGTHLHGRLRRAALRRRLGSGRAHSEKGSRRQLAPGGIWRAIDWRP